MSETRGFCHNTDQEAGIVAYGVPAAPFFGQIFQKAAPNGPDSGPFRASIEPRSFCRFYTSQRHLLQHVARSKSTSRNHAHHISTSIYDERQE